MPSRTLSAFALFLSTAAIILAARYADNNNLQDGRHPASLSKKEMMIGERHAHPLRHTEKIRGPLETSVDMVGAVPDNPGDVFVLNGVVTSESDLQDVSFEWAIPSDVEVVSGVTQGQISYIRAGIPTQVQLTLRTRTGSNHQVHLITSGALNRVRFAASAQYNTLIQQLLK